METKRLEFYKNFEKELINKKIINNNKKFDIDIEKLLNKKNFLNNQNYIISKYIKDSIIQNYNLYEYTNRIEEKKGFHKVKYYKRGNRQIRMIINLIIIFLIIGTLLSIFILESLLNKTVPGIFGLLFVIFCSILALRIGGTLSGNTSNHYIFYRNKSDIYYKLK